MSNYHCKTCGRKYVRKVYLDRHEAGCSLMRKTKEERHAEIEKNSDTPSMPKMYDMLLALAKRNQELEAKVDELSKWAALKKKRLHIVEWLNEHYASVITFDRHMSACHVTPSDYDSVTKFDYVEGVSAILRRWFPVDEESSLPIKSFDQKDSTFFIKTDEGWRSLETRELSGIISDIGRRVMNHFVSWQESNKHRMTTDEYASEYTTKLQKSLGTNFTQEQIITRLRRSLYKYLKMNLKSVYQFEFTF